MKIRPVGVQLPHADRWTDRHDEANSHFPQFCERTSKLNYEIITSTECPYFKL
jgi:hypothetical protein